MHQMLIAYMDTYLLGSYTPDDTEHFLEKLQMMSKLIKNWEEHSDSIHL